MSGADKNPSKKKPLEVPNLPKPDTDPLKKAPKEAPQLPKTKTYPQRTGKEVPVPKPIEKPQINDPEVSPDTPQNLPENDHLT